MFEWILGSGFFRLRKDLNRDKFNSDEEEQIAGQFSHKQ